MAFAPPPPPGPLQAATSALCAAVTGGDASEVRRACKEVLAPLSDHFGVKPPAVRVLGVRPHEVNEGVTTYQLYGDYTPDTQRVRVWLRTAVLGKVSSPRSFVSTLLHEFCHHLDCAKLAWPGSFHTRGFYGRVDQLYHLALATPDERRRPLQWVKLGGVWRIDWTRSRTAPG
ncbi:MAG: hypothetical protein JWM10_4517 [Myxococcaceae bacterium]|nr:hypothetical protein [Myxococcaceae bacterium]